MDDEFRRQTERHQAIVIDFSGLPTLGSTGTSRLVQWLQQAAARNVRVTAANVTPSLRALFDLTSLSAVLPTTPTSSRALRHRTA
ncbi:MAG: STAS domain-containing protein [Acidobacteriota bacterium]